MAYDRAVESEEPADSMETTADARPLDQFDQRFRGRLGALIGGQSPWAVMNAWQDWAYHLAASPGRQLALLRGAASTAAALSANAATLGQAPWVVEPLPADRRFRDPAWTRFPFNMLAQGQLALEDQWRAAVGDLRGVNEHHLRRVEFLGQFVLNALAPVNFPATNPEVWDAALKTGGWNFLTGAQLFWSDIARLQSGRCLAGLDDFVVGKTMAITPGQVVYRNRLMELIQYTPATPTVHREPVLITPAWIMKYYILDLTPGTSLVRYLVDQGYTVFIVSWRNPDASDSELTFEDYRSHGVDKAIEVVREIVGGEKIHAVGYCLGGTSLAISAAAIDRDRRDLLASLSLLAAQTDFEEAGELMMFIDESQLSLLEDMMGAQGYLDARQMAGAFYALRTNEMLWSQMVDRYLISTPKPLGPLDAWLADSTRMPARMHGEYLRQLFLENRFAHGRYEVGGDAVAMKDIKTPVFALGAERDHIAPWRSVYKIELYGSTDTTFVLSGGGHNQSVVSPPGKPGAYYRVRTTSSEQPYVEPGDWLAAADQEDGSWWPCWTAWLERHSRGERIPPPPMGLPDRGPLGPAPGTYVFGT
ncbi:MAG: PHA/PHB synthase family protein [Caulobacteraceae bacterium]